uniref:Uncharacterized protein n=1 Tax=Oryza brachyantha TaxID=4533 RepID=J3MJG0_ORYBR
MASSSKAVFLALLLAALSATATMAHHHDEGHVVYSPGEHCRPGEGFPEHPLPRCRALAKQQCLGRAAGSSPPWTTGGAGARRCGTCCGACTGSWASPTSGTPRPRCSRAAGGRTSSARRRAPRRSAAWTSPTAPAASATGWAILGINLALHTIYSICIVFSFCRETHIYIW